jgi:hypothetical protein
MKNMTQALIVVVCFVICAGCAAGVNDQPLRSTGNAGEASEASAASSASTVQSDSWDFGDVSAGSVLTHEFVIVNDSEKDLAIKDTTTSCGCTVSEINNKLLKPGESTIVSIKLDTKGYTGSVQQFVYVNTDSMDKPIIRLTVKAKVLP